MKIDTSNITKLADRIQKNILKKALRAGCKLVLAQARTNAPVQSGMLRQALTSKVDAVKGTTFVYGLIGIKSKFAKMINGKLKKPSRYAHFIETGKFRKPFLLPSFLGKQEQYLDKVKEVIGREIQSAIAK